MKVYAVIEEDSFCVEEQCTINTETIIKLFDSREKAEYFKHSYSSEGDAYKAYMLKEHEFNRNNPDPITVIKPPRDDKGFIRSNTPEYYEYQKALSFAQYNRIQKRQREVGNPPPVYYYTIKEMTVE